MMMKNEMIYNIYICMLLVTMFSCVCILTYSCVEGLYDTHQPIVVSNAMLIPTVCNITNSSIAVGKQTVCDCVDDNCSCNTNFWYQKTNTYYFPLVTEPVTLPLANKTDEQIQIQKQIQNGYATGKLTFEWKEIYPTNDVGQVVDCYYNKCVYNTLLQDCDNSHVVGNVSLSLYSIDTNDMILTVLCSIGLIPAVITILLLCIVIKTYYINRYSKLTTVDNC